MNALLAVVLLISPFTLELAATLHVKVVPIGIMSPGDPKAKLEISV